MEPNFGVCLTASWDASETKKPAAERPVFLFQSRRASVCLDLSRTAILFLVRRPFGAVFGILILRWLFVFSALAPRLTTIFISTLALLLTLVPLLLTFLSGLIHGVENTEIMLRVLEIGFCKNAVASSGRVAAQLEILLEQLLRRTTDPQIGSVTVKHMVAVQRCLGIAAA